MKTSKNTWIGCLCALGCEIIFGFSYLFTKDATDTASPLSLLGWRFLISFFAISICAATGIMKIRLKGKSLTPLLTVALFSPIIYFIGEAFGINPTTASERGACI